MSNKDSGAGGLTISGFGLEYPGLFAIQHPRIAAMVLIALVASALASLASIRFDDNIQRAMSSNSVYARDYRAFEQGLGTKTSDFIVLVASNETFGPAELERLRDMTLDVALLDDVLTVLSPFSARFAKNHEQFPGAPVFPQDISTETLTDRLPAYRAGNMNQPEMISPDGRIMIVTIAVDPANGRARLRDTHADIIETLSDYTGDGFTLTVTGEDAIAFEIVGGLQRDLITLNLLGCLIALFMALLIFGDLTVALVAVVPAILGTLTALSLFVLFGLPMTVISNVIPVLVLVLGLADSIHLTMYFKKSPADLSAKERAELSIREIGPACGLTALTTAIAFAAVAMVDNEQLREFALIGGLGVMVSYVVVIMFFAFLAPLCVGAKAGRSRGDWFKVPPLIGRLVLSRDRAIMVASALIAAASIWGFLRTEPWFHFNAYLPVNSEIRQANEKINETFGGFFRMWHELDLTGDETSGDDWQRLTALTDTVAAAAPDYTVVSLVTIARWFGRPETMPDRTDLSDLPESILTQFLSLDGNTARVVTFAPEPMANRQTLETHDRIERAAGNAGAIRTVGFPVILRHEPAIVIGQLEVSLIAACLIAVALVALAFRWPALLVVLVVPNMLPLILTAASLHLIAGGLLNPTAMMALTIAFGIAIDDSIHFINRFRLERARGHDVDQALNIAIDRTGRVMIATTLLISAGLLVTLTSPFTMVRLFGIMLILTFITALLADLVLLPALLRQKWVRS
ncbi:RND family transporter [Hoeflea sp. TYP-13]|uniref:RND family transporter n=1 Tax=Hoeflea sp. TYP-13 TaxID=3230023 RepID=UPI0034C6A4DA